MVASAIVTASIASTIIIAGLRESVALTWLTVGEGIEATSAAATLTTEGVRDARALPSSPITEIIPGTDGMTIACCKREIGG